MIRRKKRQIINLTLFGGTQSYYYAITIDYYRDQTQIFVSMRVKSQNNVKL